MSQYQNTHENDSASTAVEDDPEEDTTIALPEHDPRLSPIESEVLAEYRKLSENLAELAKKLEKLAEEKPTPEVADGLRVLERKTALVCTALKSSVYGIVLMQSIDGAQGEETAESSGG